MLDALMHRGPDDAGVYLDPEGDFVFGARRLSIIDVENGHQPLSNETGTIWAVLNGEIYNHPSLHTRLRERGHQLSTRSDTEVLVHLYEDHGVDLVHALEGMYAFAIWDSQRGRLLLGRDRFGEKPLFYFEQGGRLTFASELVALEEGLEGAPSVDPDAFDAYFVLGYVPGPGSIVEGVRQLAPGSVLTWEGTSRVSLSRRYWSPSSPSTGKPVASFSELAGETHGLLDKSVKSRMISDVPLGVFLSGGVDSTLVAALAARHGPGRLKTFTVGYDVGSVDERLAARRSAAAIGAEHHELVLTQQDIAECTLSYLRELDQPLADEALIPLRALSQFARTEVTVAVGGEGADELFGGYPRYRWLARGARVPPRLQRHVFERASALLRRHRASSRSARVLDLVSPMSPLELHLHWVTGDRASMRRELYGPRLTAHRGSEAAALTGLVDEFGLDGAIAGSFMRLDQIRWLPDDVLMKADRASMRASLEFRTPFLNREVAEFAASIPAVTHLQNGGKVLLRTALAQMTPEASHRRKKIAFRSPVGSWLRGPLAVPLAEHVATSSLYGEGWFRRVAVERLVREHQEGSADWSRVLWPLFVLGTWLDKRER